MELTGDLNFLSELIKIDQESFDEYNLNISEISFAKDERYDDDLHIYFKVEVVNGANLANGVFIIIVFYSEADKIVMIRSKSIEKEEFHNFDIIDEVISFKSYKRMIQFCNTTKKILIYVRKLV